MHASISFCHVWLITKFTMCLRNSDQAVYFRFLDISIQNLRFEGPSFAKPAAIIMPESKEQLISSVLCCKEGSWEIRVRSGGHSYEGTSYVTYDGTPFVLIDLMNLDRISIDLESETAWVEGGATLGQIYYAISEASNVHGFPAGACPTVGIGGHISGGGFGAMFRKFGLAADNVVDALLVDVEGRFLDRGSMGEEVFWAIRGGGGGVWGIVFAWRIRLVRVPRVLTGFSLSRPGSKNHIANLFHKWQSIAPKLDDEFSLSLVLGAGLGKAHGTGVSATFKGLYLGPIQAALSGLEKVFPELEIKQWEVREMPWIESMHYFSGLKNGTAVSKLKDRFLVRRPYYKAKSDYVRNPISRTGLASAIEELEKMPKAYIILDAYGGAMARISNESIPFPHREGILFMIQYLIQWKDGEDEQRENYMEWMRGFYEVMAPHVSMNPRAAYVNYMDFDLGTTESAHGRVVGEDAVEEARIWGEKYFMHNYDRLVRVKTAIDPLNVFRHEQGIFPRSSKSVSRSST